MIRKPLRRTFSRVRTLWRRVIGKKAPYSSSNPLSHTTLGSLLGASEQSSELVMWPWENISSNHLGYFFFSFFSSTLIFLSFCSCFLGFGIMTGVQAPKDLSPLFFNVLTTSSSLIFLVDCIFIFKEGKKFSIFTAHIQSQCLGLKGVLSTEFSVFILPDSNSLPINWKLERKFLFPIGPNHLWSLHESHAVCSWSFLPCCS